MRRDFHDRIHQERAARRDLLEVPPLLHRQAEAGRLGRSYRPFQAALCQEGSAEGKGKEVMIGRRAWVGAAKLITGSFGAFTNGLTSAMPTKGADRNVDMLIGGQAVIEGVMMR